MTDKIFISGGVTMLRCERCGYPVQKGPDQFVTRVENGVENYYHTPACPRRIAAAPPAVATAPEHGAEIALGAQVKCF